MLRYRGQVTNFRRPDWFHTPAVEVVNHELFEPEPVGGSTLKVYMSGQWVVKNVRVYLNGQWVTRPLRAYVGGSFT